MSSPKIVAIIGSTRFKAFHLGAAQRETLRGNIVLIAGFFHHVDNFPISEEVKHQLDDLAEEKVKLADEVFVVNVNGYVGETTQRLLRVAVAKGRPVRWMEEPTEQWVAGQNTSYRE